MACVEHVPRYVVVADCWECARCLCLLPAFSGMCRACLRPYDDHAFYRTRSIPLQIPRCP